MEIQTMNLQEDLKIIYEFSLYDELAEWLENKIWGLYHDNVNQSIKPKDLIPLVLQWIHSNYQYNISLQQFAADHHVSLGYLSRLFKVQMEDTFSDYLIRYRIEKAKDLLTEGRVRLSDVSSMVGYEDAKHFSQLFKKIVGEPPVAFVKRNQLT
jgi:YesN/AraC family two-component response regulator